MNTCASCSNPGSNVQSFTWFVDDEPDSSFKKIAQLNKDKSNVWLCEKCDTMFHQRRGVVNDSMITMPHKHYNALSGWGNKELHLPAEHKNIFKKIGGVFIPFADRPDGLTYPCRCKIKGADWLDFCIISFQSFAPVGYEFVDAHAIYLADDIEEIDHSEHALSQDARYALSNAEERDRDFFPTILTATGGNRFLLLTMQHFFSMANYKAPELKVVEQWKKGDSYTQYRFDPKKITWIIADQDKEMIDFERPPNAALDETARKAIQILANPDPHFSKVEAARELRKYNNRDAVRALVNAITDKEFLVRNHAFKSLMEIFYLNPADYKDFYQKITYKADMSAPENIRSEFEALSGVQRTD
ncbi:HEAT repeat domain-containing protein [Desulfococcaceae bacterium HSG9]|nr:HEAT repeat domain-containing protein [Desulfococcaceae bacterium HSG9]